MIYYIIFFILFLGSFLEQIKVKHKQLLFIYIFSCIILILFVGTRHDFGRDYFVYKEAFSNLNIENYSQYLFEPLFACLCIILRPFGFNFFILFIGAITIICKTCFIKQFSNYPLFSLLIYYSLSVVLYEMGQMRQGIAMIFAFWAFNACLQKKSKIFWLNILLAVSFHYSAVVLIPCYWLCKLNVKYRYIVFSTSLLLGFSVINFSSFFIQVASYISVNHIALKIIDYAGRNVALGVNLSLILRIIVLFVFLKVSNPKKTECRILSILYFYGVFLYVVFGSAPEIAMRSAVYFKLLEIFIYPYFVVCFLSKINRISVISLISIYLIWTITNMFIEHSDAFFPYKSFLL